jgi:hypothetical protein
MKRVLFGLIRRIWIGRWRVGPVTGEEKGERLEEVVGREAWGEVVELDCGRCAKSVAMGCGALEVLLRERACWSANGLGAAEAPFSTGGCWKLVLEKREVRACGC